jgi:hypothetical protein
MNQNNAVLFHFLKQKQRQGRFQLLAQGGFSASRRNDDLRVEMTIFASK